MASKTMSMSCESEVPLLNIRSSFGLEDFADSSYYSVIGPPSPEPSTQVEGFIVDEFCDIETNMPPVAKTKECRFKCLIDTVSQKYEFKLHKQKLGAFSLPQICEGITSLECIPEILNLKPNVQCHLEQTLSNTVISSQISEVECRYPLVNSLRLILEGGIQPVDEPGINESSCATDSSTETISTIKPAELQRRCGHWENTDSVTESTESSGDERRNSFSELLANKSEMFSIISKTRSDTQTDMGLLANFENQNAKIEETMIDIDTELAPKQTDLHLFNFATYESENTLSITKKEDEQIHISNENYSEIQMDLVNEPQDIKIIDGKSFSKFTLRQQIPDVRFQRDKRKSELMANIEHSIRRTQDNAIRTYNPAIPKPPPRCIYCAKEESRVHEAVLQKNVTFLAGIGDVKLQKKPRNKNNINWLEKRENRMRNFKKIIDDIEPIVKCSTPKVNMLEYSNLPILDQYPTLNSYSEPFDGEELKRPSKISSFMHSDDDNSRREEPYLGTTSDYRETNRTSAGSGSSIVRRQAPSETFFAYLRKNQINRSLNEDVITLRPHFSRGRRIYF